MIISSPGTPSSEESATFQDQVNNKDRSVLGAGFENETHDQITPTSSVDTEEGHTSNAKDNEGGVDGDVEASDDDRIVSKNPFLVNLKKSDLLNSVEIRDLRE